MVNDYAQYKVGERRKKRKKKKRKFKTLPFFFLFFSEPLGVVQVEDPLKCGGAIPLWAE
jgi:hypothetical protein